MKRVGIDFHVIDGIFQGSRSHVLEIFSRIFYLCPNIEFYIFLEQVEKLRESSPVFSLPNVTLVHMKYAGSIKRLAIQLPAFQRRFQLDILHTQYISPIPSFSKTIITLHDILFETHPQYFSLLFNIQAKILMYFSSKRASHIFTVSEYSKKEISSRYKINPKDITVVHNGVDTQKFYPGTDGIDKILSVGLDSGKYILTVGRLEPRKNHLSLINAYSQLDTDMPLVIIGQRHFGYQKIETLINKLGISHKVMFFENVQDFDLPSFYRHAKFFVYPTWAEGFGMPVIEAMASGIPVITSNNTSLFEVAEGASLLISPDDTISLRNAMIELIDNDSLANDLTERGLKQIDLFKWSLSAEKVKKIYDEILYE